MEDDDEFLSSIDWDAIEVQALASKSKVAMKEKEGVNSAAEKTEGATTNAAIPSVATTLDPPSSVATPLPPTTDAAADADASNPLSLRSLLERNRPRPPPDTLSQLELAVARFEALAPRLPPPPPLSMLCPGVYKKGGGSGNSRFSRGQAPQQQPTQQETQRSSGGGASFSDAGCGAPLEPCSYRAPAAPGSGGSLALVHSWRCSLRPRCSYQETPPERIAAPRLTLEVVLAATFKGEEEEKEEEKGKDKGHEENTSAAETTTPAPDKLPRCLVPPPPPPPPSYELLVAPARGAEDCVAFCGGVGPVLCALGLRGLVPQAEERSAAAAEARAEAGARDKPATTASSSAAASVPASARAPAPPLLPTPPPRSPPALSLRIPLACYERLEARLLAARVARSPVLPASGRVPAGVLAALRGGGAKGGGGAAAAAPAGAGLPGRPGDSASAAAPASTAAAAPDGDDANDGEHDDDVAALFARIPLPLAASLLPFQREGVAFALRNRGRALVGDEMGVGKTLQALAAVAAYRAEWPALVVCPASLRLAWAGEAERWLSGVLRPSRVAVVDGAASALSPADSPDVAITSFEMLARRSCARCTRDAARAAMERGRGGGGSGGGGGGGGGGLGGGGGGGGGVDQGSSSSFAPCPGSAGGCMAGRGWRVLVVDESHVLRTGARGPPDARATEAAAACAARATRAIFLTGTPSLSKPFDLWRQVDALVPGLLPRTRDAFAARYCGRRLVPLFGFSSSSSSSSLGAAATGGCFFGQGTTTTTTTATTGANTTHSLPPFAPFLSSSATPQQQLPMRVDVSGLTHGRELAAVLRRAVMVRRLKADVCGQLPPKRRQVVLLPRPRPGDWRRLSRAAAEKFQGVGGGGGGGGGGVVVGGEGFAAAARKRKGGAGGQQQQQRARPPPPPPPPLFSLAELAAARTEKQGQRKNKKARRSGGGADDAFEEEEEEEEPALAFLGDDDEEEEEEDFVDLDDDDNNDENGASRPFQRPDARSDAHRTALAKLPAVIEWLSTVFGCGGAGSSSAAASNYSQGATSSSSSTTTATTHHHHHHHQQQQQQQQRELPKTIIFAHHHDVMDALAQALTSFGIRFVRIDGSVDGEDRRAAVEAFRSGARGVRAALLSVTAAGTGLDFASASSVVFAELPDEPALVRQAEDRAHRRGRGESGGKGMPLNVYFLIAKGTSDERRWRALDAGLQRVAEALADEGVKGGGSGPGGQTRPNSQAVSQTPTPLRGCVGFGRRSSFFGSFSSSGRGGGGDARGLAVDRIREVPSQAATQAAAAAAAAAAKAAAAAASLLAAVRAPPETLDGSGSRGGGTGSSTPASSSGPSERFLSPSSSPPPPSVKAPSPTPGPRPRPAAAAAEAVAAATPRTVSPAADDAATPAAPAESENGKHSLASSPFSPFPPFPRLVWFELSPHTGRLHLHGSPDGSNPLGLSVPLEAMAACCSSSSSSSERGSDGGGSESGLAGAVALLSAALVAPGGPCCPATDRPLPPQRTLRDWARDAAELAGELFELRGVLRARFAAGGRLLRPPLTMVAAGAGEGDGGEAAATAGTTAPAATTEAEDDGSGRGTVRHDAPRAPLPEVLERLLQEQKRRMSEVADGDKNDENKKDNSNDSDFPQNKEEEARLPPPSSSLLEVPVAGIGGRLRPYLQPFDSSGRRLCLACGNPTPCQLPASAPLLLLASSGSSSGRKGAGGIAANGGGRSLLFCGGRCDALHAARTSASAARAALFRVERGVCCACGLDCHALVRDLRAIQKKKNNGRVLQGSDAADNKKRPMLLSWRRRRLALILERAPSFRGARAAAAAARLAGSAVGGHAWQADHVVAVHRGGGSCGVGNLRTLCVPCHAEVTAAQARERARRRRREKRRRDGGGGGGGEGGGGEGDEDAGDENDDDEDGDDDFLPAGAPAGLQRALMLHARMGAGPRFIDDDEEEEEEEDEDDEEDGEEESDDDEGDGGGGRPRPPAAARRRARKAAAAQQLMPPPPPRLHPPPPVEASAAAAAAPAAAAASRPLAELAAMAGRGSKQQQGRKRSK